MKANLKSVAKLEYHGETGAAIKDEWAYFTNGSILARIPAAEAQGMPALRENTANMILTFAGGLSWDWSGATTLHRDDISRGLRACTAVLSEAPAKVSVSLQGTPEGVEIRSELYGDKGFYLAEGSQGMAVENIKVSSKKALSLIGRGKGAVKIMTATTGSIRTLAIKTPELEAHLCEMQDK